MTSPSSGSQVLYEKHETIHAREVDGVFDRLRTAAVICLLGCYYLLAWLPWEGRQAILFDLPARKFHIFWLTFWPQDFFFLSWLLIICALSLFFFTAIAGRLWCGFACPQTVWTEAFVWLGRLIEGNWSKRRKLDKAPWNANKVLRRGGKYTAWVVFALLTGFTFVGYFTPIRELGARLAGFELGGWEWFWIIFYSLATLGNAGFLREQVCKYMCPYARFQSAMFDRDTLIISYDEERGEPRGKRRRGVDPATVSLGDCIDCKLCVQACPTGIDIREGLQYECIACAACIDACDSVMDRVDYPRGLIRYTTQNAVDGKPRKVLRTRTILYALLLTGLCVGFVVAVANRVPAQLDIMRDRNALYRQLPGGRIENVFTLRILNKDRIAHQFQISTTGLPGAVLEIDSNPVEVEAGSIVTLFARIHAPREAAGAGSSNIALEARGETGSDIVLREQARFVMPP